MVWYRGRSNWETKKLEWQEPRQVDYSNTDKVDFARVVRLCMQNKQFKVPKILKAATHRNSAKCKGKMSASHTIQCKIRVDSFIKRMRENVVDAAISTSLHYSLTVALSRRTHCMQISDGVFVLLRNVRCHLVGRSHPSRPEEDGSNFLSSLDAVFMKIPEQCQCKRTKSLSHGTSYPKGNSG